MNKRRLKVLRDHLATVPKKHFNLQTWTYINGGSIVNGSIVEVGCGTTACAMGWACSIPEFRKAGLKLARWDGPEYRGFVGFDAVKKFFDIDYKVALYLFSPYKYKNAQLNDPNTVIGRIDELLASV